MKLANYIFYVLDKDISIDLSRQMYFTLIKIIESIVE